MKKFIIAIAVMLVAQTISAQCNELFISEYIEGSRNNKAIEIYNPTDKSVDLSNYRFTRWQNGSSSWSPQYSDILSGTIAAYSTVQLVLDRTDTTKVGQDTAVSILLLNKATLLLSKDYNTSFSMSFNGDDALSLDKKDPNPTDPNNPYLPVDIFGKIGERPALSGSNRTIGWSDSFPHSTGLGKWYTIDKSLIRKYNIIGGTKANPAYFNPKVQWEIYPEDMFDSFGVHNCACNTANVNRVKRNTLTLFPNPAKDRVFIPLAGIGSKIQVFDLTGKQVIIEQMDASFAGMHGVWINLGTLAKGNFIVYYLNTAGESYTAQLIKE